MKKTDDKWAILIVMAIIIGIFIVGLLNIPSNINDSLMLDVQGEYKNFTAKDGRGYSAHVIWYNGSYGFTQYYTYSIIENLHKKTNQTIIVKSKGISQSDYIFSDIKWSEYDYVERIDEE